MDGQVVRGDCQVTVQMIAGQEKKKKDYQRRFRRIWKVTGGGVLRSSCFWLRGTLPYGNKLPIQALRDFFFSPSSQGDQQVDQFWRRRGHPEGCNDRAAEQHRVNLPAGNRCMPTKDEKTQKNWRIILMRKVCNLLLYLKKGGYTTPVTTGPLVLWVEGSIPGQELPNIF